MIFPDLRTLILNQILSYVICTLVLGLLWYQNRHRFAGIGLWFINFILQTIALILIFLRGSIPDWLSIILGGNALIIAGIIILYIGLEQFLEKPSKQWHNLFIFLIGVVIHSYFTFSQPNLAARNITMSVGTLLVSLQIVWLLFYRIEPRLRPITRMAAFVFMAFSLSIFVRIWINIFLPMGDDFFGNTRTFDSFVIFVYQMILFFALFSVFVIINKMLFLQLHTQQEALQKSESRYRQLIEFSPNAIVVFQHGRIVFVNPAAIHLLAASSANDLLGRSVFDFVHPDYQMLAQQRIAQVLNQGQIVPLTEERFIRLDGTIIDVEVTTRPLEYQGQPALQTIVRDITERKRTETILRLRLDLWEFSTTHSVDALMQHALDEIGKLTNSPIGFYHFVEPDEASLLLHTWSTRTHREFCHVAGPQMIYDLDRAGVWIDCVREQKPIIHNDYRALAQRKGLPPGHVEITRELVVPTLRDGQVVSILGVGNKPTDYHQKDVNLVAYVADVIWSIIERKRTDNQIEKYQQQLELQNLELRKLSLAIEQSGSMVVITDATGAIEYANPRFEQTSGYALAEAKGQNLRILKSGSQSQEFYANLWQTISHGQIWRGELHNKRKDGTLYWAAATIAPVQDSAGVIRNYIAIKEDVTERKQMEADLERLATTDSLTNTFNRRQLSHLANQELKRAQRYQHSTSVIILDIDYFKQINDRYGHGVGDLAIQQTACTLATNLRTIDYLGRYGGDEFVIILPQTDLAQGRQIAERLRLAVGQQQVIYEQHTIRLSISLGLACVVGQFDTPPLTFESIVTLADQGLYIAKAAGRNCVGVAPSDP